MKNAIDNYAEVMSKIIFQEGITSFDELKSSSLYNEYWIAAYNLSKKIISYNYKKINRTAALTVSDIDDYVHDATITLISTFDAQAKHILFDPNHNYNSYSTRTIKNRVFINPTRKFRVNVNGKDGEKAFLHFISMYTPISFNDHDDLMLVDTFMDEDAHNCYNDIDDYISIKEIALQGFKQLNAKHQKRGQSFVYMVDILSQFENLDIDLKNDDIVEIYNSILFSFLSSTIQNKSEINVMYDIYKITASSDVKKGKIKKTDFANWRCYNHRELYSLNPKENEDKYKK